MVCFQLNLFLFASLLYFVFVMILFCLDSYLNFFILQVLKFMPSKSWSFLTLNILIFTSQEDVAKEFGVPVQYQRFWLWAKRQNHTYRPNRLLTSQEETQTVSGFWSLCFYFLNMMYVLWPADEQHFWKKCLN